MEDLKKYKEVERSIVRTRKLLQEDWNDGYPAISTEQIQRLIGKKNKECAVVIHQAKEGVLTNKTLEKILEEYKYAIVRKYYYTHEMKENNHTFFVVKKEDGSKMIYDSWYLTNKSKYFTKCFDDDIEKYCEFYVNGPQQSDRQGVCAVFALATYFSKRLGDLKNLDKRLKEIDSRIRVIKPNKANIR